MHMDPATTLATIRRYRDGDDSALAEIPVWCAEPDAALGEQIRHPHARITTHGARLGRSRIRGAGGAVAVARVQQDTVPLVVVSDVPGQPHHGHVISRGTEVLLRGLDAAGQTVASVRCMPHPMTVANFRDAMRRRVLSHGGTWLGKCPEDTRADTDGMVVEIRVIHRPGRKVAEPWLVRAYDPGRDDYDTVGAYAAEPDALAHAATKPMSGEGFDAGGLIVERAIEWPEHWILMMMYASGLGHSVGERYATEGDAEAARREYLPQVGEVSQDMMASSSLSCVVVRETGDRRWTAARGIGSHTTHVPGSHASREEAAEAGRAAIRHAWDQEIARWARIARREGVEMRVTAVPPPVSVRYPATGVSAWDAPATRATPGGAAG